MSLDFDGSRATRGWTISSSRKLLGGNWKAALQKTKTIALYSRIANAVYRSIVVQAFPQVNDISLRFSAGSAACFFLMDRMRQRVGIAGARQNIAF